MPSPPSRPGCSKQESFPRPPFLCIGMFVVFAFVSAFTLELNTAISNTRAPNSARSESQPGSLLSRTSSHVTTPAEIVCNQWKCDQTYICNAKGCIFTSNCKWSGINRLCTKAREMQFKDIGGCLMIQRVYNIIRVSES